MILRTAPDGTKTKLYYDGINQLMVREKPVGGVWRTKKINALKEPSIGQIIAHRVIYVRNLRDRPFKDRKTYFQ